jgi:hypothetical protein
VSPRCAIIAAGVVLALAARAVRCQQPADSNRLDQDRVHAAARLFATPDSARLRGYTRLRPLSRVPALNPFVGEHWIKERWLRLVSLDPERPAYLMYYPIGGTEQLVGFGYAFVQPSEAPPPPGGYHWHLHHPCSGLPGIGTLLVGGAEECRTLGGTPAPTQIVMLHVWLDPPNPAGEFAPENPALPFVSAGLIPPDSMAFADQHQATFLRELGLALGETIGARPRLGTMSEFGADSLVFQRRAGPLRARLSVLAATLRRAEQAGDRTRYAAAATRAVDTWRGLKQVYLDLAPGPVVRTLLVKWFDAVLMGGGHGPAH